MRHILVGLALIAVLAQPVRAEGEVIVMEATQLRMLIQEVLQEIDLYSEDAVELLMLTAAQESHLGHYLMQVNNGPAKGIFQCEINTEKDIWENFLEFKPRLAKRVRALMGEADWDHLQLKGNLLYQIALARVHYYRVPEKLPDRNDVEAMAKYYKKYYNTHLGRATWQAALKNYRRLAHD